MNSATSPANLTAACQPVRCREIAEADLAGVLALLVEGFPRRSRRYWSEGLQRLRARTVPADCPRYGFLIEVGDTIVGCLILIVSEQIQDGRIVRRANVSSWYVKPAHRFQASMLVSVAFRLKAMTFLNISPAPHTLPILEAQGYKRYASGQMMVVPTISRRGLGVQVRRLKADDGHFDETQLPEIELLRRHARAGCIVLVCGARGRLEPFVFARRRIIRTVVPAAHLLWCRDIAAFTDHAGALGRHLLRLGRFAVSLDANGRIRDLPGAWRPGSAPKFYRGPDRPRLGDLADTELVYFGA